MGVGPRVYISYSWHTPGSRERVFEFSERLRSTGIDSRIDRYYAESLHGFAPPTGRAGDARPPWTTWQEDQIRSADFVLVVCSREYRDSPPQSGVASDVAFMTEELRSSDSRRSKFIPVGFGPYESNAQYMPLAIAGEHYYDLETVRGCDGLLRRIGSPPPAPGDAPGTPGADKTGNGGAMTSEVKLFISHAHQDNDVCEGLVSAFELAMAVPDRAIRCTSLPGYKLELGAMAPEALRRELSSAEMIIALLTPNSLASQWVLFELGAAWSQAKQAVPLLGGGLQDKDIPGPFRGAAGGQLTDASALDQLLEQLAQALNWPSRNPVAARARLSKLAAYVGGKSFFDDNVEQEVKATFGAKRARIGAKQGSVVDYITHNRRGRSNISQDELYAHFRNLGTGLYYRLEQLRYLGFLSRQEIGTRDGEPVFGWTLSKKYREEIGQAP